MREKKEKREKENICDLGNMEKRRAADWQRDLEKGLVSGSDVSLRRIVNALFFLRRHDNDYCSATATSVAWSLPFCPPPPVPLPPLLLHELHRGRSFHILHENQAAISHWESCGGKKTAGNNPTAMLKEQRTWYCSITLVLFANIFPDTGACESNDIYGSIKKTVFFLLRQRWIIPSDGRRGWVWGVGWGCSRAFKWRVDGPMS